MKILNSWKIRVKVLEHFPMLTGTPELMIHLRFHSGNVGDDSTRRQVTFSSDNTWRAAPSHAYVYKEWTSPVDYVYKE